MQNEVIVAIIAFLGTLTGAAGGVLTSSRLVNHRLECLEKRVGEHNNIATRTYILEEKVKVANHRIKDLEDGKGLVK